MFIGLRDLNTTEIRYPGAPSVEEQMSLFHSGPMDIVRDDLVTTREAGHKQQNIEAIVVPTTSAQGLPDGMGEEGSPQAASEKPRKPGKGFRGGRSSLMRYALPAATFVGGLAAGLAYCWLRPGQKAKA